MTFYKMTQGFYVLLNKSRQAIYLLGSEARHAAVCPTEKTRRPIDLFDGKDLSYQGRIDSVTPERVEGLILNERKASSSPIELVLCQGLLKGQMDWLVEKSVRSAYNARALLTHGR